MTKLIISYLDTHHTWECEKHLSNREKKYIDMQYGLMHAIVSSLNSGYVYSNEVLGSLKYYISKEKMP